MILLSLRPVSLMEHWGHRHVLPHLALTLFLNVHSGAVTLHAMLMQLAVFIQFLSTPTPPLTPMPLVSLRQGLTA